MQNAKKTYQFNYGLIGCLGLLLPIIDVWRCGWVIPGSISVSYYTGAVVPFTLILGGLGLILICNPGFSMVDRICNRVAGAAALAVIFFPCQSPRHIAVIPFPVIHYAAAVTLFLTFCFMSGFVFTQFRGTGMTKNKRIRNRIYRVCALLILLGLPIAYYLTFWGEVWMLSAFGVAYLVQSKVILKD